MSEIVGMEKWINLKQLYIRLECTSSHLQYYIGSSTIWYSYGVLAPIQTKRVMYGWLLSHNLIDTQVNSSTHAHKTLFHGLLESRYCQIIFIYFFTTNLYCIVLVLLLDTPSIPLSNKLKGTKEYNTTELMPLKRLPSRRERGGQLYSNSIVICKTQEVVSNRPLIAKHYLQLHLK